MGVHVTSTFGGFDSAQLDVLQATFDLVCKELGITSEDDEHRARIARAVISLAESGELDTDRLTVHAISRFKEYNRARPRSVDYTAHR